jgi:hypothetical protein
VRSETASEKVRQDGEATPERFTADTGAKTGPAGLLFYNENSRPASQERTSTVGPSNRRKARSPFVRGGLTNDIPFPTAV